MTSDPCSAIPRSTLLNFALGHQDQNRDGGLASRGLAEVAAHVRHCGCCRQLVRRLSGSRQALATLGFPGRFAGWSAQDSGADPDGFSGVSHLRSDVATRLTTLRGRILGAARDRAWSELGRWLRALLGTSRRLVRHGSPSSAAVAEVAEAARSWDEQRAAVGSLARRLEGLGIHVDLSDLPRGRPSAPALPWVIRHLSDVLKVVGGADSGHTLAEDYQPSAAPSFLDSLPPL